MYDQGVDVDLKLLEATHRGDILEIDRLLRQGTNIDTQDNGGVTALMIASDRGNVQAAGRFINGGASTSLRTAVAGNTCLHYAAQGCHVAVVQRLLEHDPTLAGKRNEHGDTALMMACVSKATSGSCETIKALVEADRETVNWLNSVQYSAIHLAVRRGHGRATKEVEYLLSVGADVNTKNIRHETPLHSAAANGDEVIVDLLLKAGALVDPVDTLGNTPLLATAASGRGGAAQVFQRLLTAGSNIRATNNKSQNVMSLALAHLSAGKRLPSRTSIQVDPDCVGISLPDLNHGAQAVAPASEAYNDIAAEEEPVESIPGSAPIEGAQELEEYRLSCDVMIALIQKEWEALEQQAAKLEATLLEGWSSDEGPSRGRKGKAGDSGGSTARKKGSQAGGKKGNQKDGSQKENGKGPVSSASLPLSDHEEEEVDKKVLVSNDDSDRSVPVPEAAAPSLLKAKGSRASMSEGLSNTESVPPSSPSVRSNGSASALNGKKETKQVSSLKVPPEEKTGALDPSSDEAVARELARQEAHEDRQRWHQSSSSFTDASAASVEWSTVPPKKKKNMQEKARAERTANEPASTSASAQDSSSKRKERSMVPKASNSGAGATTGRGSKATDGKKNPSLTAKAKASSKWDNQLGRQPSRPAKEVGLPPTAASKEKVRASGDLPIPIDTSNSRKAPSTSADAAKSSAAVRQASPHSPSELGATLPPPPPAVAPTVVVKGWGLPLASTPLSAAPAPRAAATPLPAAPAPLPAAPQPADDPAWGPSQPSQPSSFSIVPPALNVVKGWGPIVNGEPKEPGKEIGGWGKPGAAAVTRPVPSGVSALNQTGNGSWSARPGALTPVAQVENSSVLGVGDWAAAISAPSPSLESQISSGYSSAPGGPLSSPIAQTDGVVWDPQGSASLAVGGRTTAAESVTSSAARSTPAHSQNKTWGTIVGSQPQQVVSAPGLTPWKTPEVATLENGATTIPAWAGAPRSSAAAPGFGWGGRQSMGPLSAPVTAWNTETASSLVASLRERANTEKLGATAAEYSALQESLEGLSATAAAAALRPTHVFSAPGELAKLSPGQLDALCDLLQVAMRNAEAAKTAVHHEQLARWQDPF